MIKKKDPTLSLVKFGLPKSEFQKRYLQFGEGGPPVLLFCFVVAHTEEILYAQWNPGKCDFVVMFAEDVMTVLGVKHLWQWSNVQTPCRLKVYTNASSLVTSKSFIALFYFLLSCLNWKSKRSLVIRL